MFETYFFRENQNTHFMFNNFLSKNRGVYEIMWKDTVEPGMRFACWIHAHNM